MLFCRDKLLSTLLWQDRDAWCWHERQPGGCKRKTCKFKHWYRQ